MKRLFVVYPFLFAIFPILFIYSNNVKEVSFHQIIFPSLLILLLVFILQLSLTIIFPDKQKKGLIILLFLLFFFSYGTFFNIFEDFTLAGLTVGRHSYLFPAWILIFLFGLFLISTIRRNLDKMTAYLNTVAIILLALIVFNVGMYELKSMDLSSKNKMELLVQKYSSQKRMETEKLPNIFYIILDGYGSSSTLKEEYSYDNSKFEEFLKQNGFYIASKSHSNYAETMLSLASSLNMEHISKLKGAVDVPLLYQMIQENRVMRILKAIGYTTIDISSNIGKLQHVRAANLNITPGNFLADEFHATLIEISMLKAFKKQLNFVYFYREKILGTFSELGKIQLKIDQPFFAFVHILPPHPPYVFGPNSEPIFGSLKLDDWGTMWEQKERYRDQVIFVNDMMMKVVHEILSESKCDPIIIIQGDHGPQLANKNKIKARMQIFNAIRLPKKDKNIFYDSITPVNTFRLIFNSYFDTGFELLEDKSYFTDYKYPYKFWDVTDSINGN